MKKITLMLVLALVLALGLTACSDKDGSSSTGNTQSASTGTQANTGDDDADTAVDDDTVDSDMVAKLTPDGAKVTTSAPGALILTSDKTLDELITFYEGVLADLGAEEVSSTKVIGWEYTGNYDNATKSISIAITDLTGSGQTITISY